MDVKLGVGEPIVKDAEGAGILKTQKDAASRWLHKRLSSCSLWQNSKREISEGASCMMLMQGRQHKGQEKDAYTKVLALHLKISNATASGVTQVT